jgi:soluble lytic murein transglycosylase-like protein
LSDEEQRRGNVAIWQQTVEQEKGLPSEWRQGIYTGIVEQLKKDYPKLSTLSTPMLMALMARESSFDPGAVSPKGAVGLMQVKPSTAEWLAKKEGRSSGNLSDPTENILAGMSYLSYLKRKFGGITPALHAYSLGPTAYIQGERNPGYVKSILGEGI